MKLFEKNKQNYAEGRVYYEETTRSVCDKENFILKSKQSTALIIEHSLLTPYLWLLEGSSCCTKAYFLQLQYYYPRMDNFLVS